MSIIIFLIILLVLVLVHEFGHFFTAKKFGIRVDEFGFGFPPKIFGIKKGETEYSINALPFGGFVKIFGENPNEENINGPDASRSFVNKAKWKQAIVLFAGVFMNFILAWILFSVGFMSGFPTSVGSEPTGVPLSDTHLAIVSVLPESPAYTAGLKSGDRIISLTYLYGKEDMDLLVDDVNPTTVKSFVVEHKNKEIEVGYIRGKDETVHVAKLTPVVASPGADPTIGIAMDMIGVVKLSVFSAFYEGMALNWHVTKSTVVGLYNLLKDAVQGNGSLSSVTGIVGMVGMTGDAYQFGFVYLLSFAALISVNLAIINLLPIPALDGGRLLFLLIEKIKGSPLNSKFTNIANTVGFAVLIIFMLVITYHDIVVKWF